jgi:hypothetical protein
VGGTREQNQGIVIVGKDLERLAAIVADEKIEETSRT